MNWDFRFSCTGCGKCCTSSPSIFLNEVVEQSSRMLFRPSLRIEPRYRGTSDEVARVGPSLGMSLDRQSATSTMRAISNRLDTYGVNLKRKAHGRPLAAYWSLTDIAAGHLGTCPNLMENGSCGIYEERPLICRAVPVNDIFRGDAQRKSLQETVSSEGYLCDTSDAAPLLVKGGKFVDGPMKNARNAMVKGRPGENLAWIPEVTRASLYYVEHFYNLDDRDFADLHSRESLGSGLGFHFGIIVLGMLDARRVDKEGAIAILENQVSAADRLRANLQRIGKIKDIAPEEARGHVLGWPPTRWGDYIEKARRDCRSFIDIISAGNCRSDRIEELKAVREAIFLGSQ